MDGEVLIAFAAAKLVDTPREAGDDVVDELMDLVRTRPSTCKLPSSFI